MNMSKWIEYILNEYVKFPVKSCTTLQIQREFHPRGMLLLLSRWFKLPVSVLTSQYCWCWTEFTWNKIFKINFSPPAIGKLILLSVLTYCHYLLPFSLQCWTYILDAQKSCFVLTITIGLTSQSHNSCAVWMKAWMARMNDV
jgi:hypothetical protein